jgi:hypothetical protein
MHNTHLTTCDSFKVDYDEHLHERFNHQWDSVTLFKMAEQKKQKLCAKLLIGLLIWSEIIYRKRERWELFQVLRKSYSLSPQCPPYTPAFI